MTHMEAELVDFKAVWEGEEIVAYRFRFGNCEDFAATMSAFKLAIPLPERRPKPEKNWLWEVDASRKNERRLGEIFDNFVSSLAAAKSQMRMF